MQPNKNYPKQNPIAISAPVPSRRWLTHEEAFNYCGGTNWWLEERKRADEIPFVVVGHVPVFDKEDLDNWLIAHKQFASDRPKPELRGAALRSAEGAS